MRKLGVLLLIVLIAPFAYGQETSSGYVGGDIPFVADFDVTWSSSAATALAGVTEAHYNQGYIDISNTVLTASLVANDSCTIAASIGSWTVPSGYPSSGDKSDGTPDSDLQFRITGIDGGDDMSIENSFDSYQYLTGSDQVCLSADAASGVTSTSFAADTRVDLAWGVDVTGTYQVQITLTAAQAP